MKPEHIIIEKKHASSIDLQALAVFERELYNQKHAEIPAHEEVIIFLESQVARLKALKNA